MTKSRNNRKPEQKEQKTKDKNVTEQHENSSSPENKNNNLLISFLIEDLKDTSEHLRGTDKKIYVTFQIFSGIFILALSSLSFFIQKGTIPLDFIWGPIGICFLTLIVIVSLWMLTFLTRSNETKQGYMHRMNFLRRMIHQHIGTSNSTLFGYWTAEQKTRKTKEKIPKENIKNIGLDELYQIALKGIIVLSLTLIIIVYFFSKKHFSFQYSEIIFPLLLISLTIFIHRDLSARAKKSKEKIEALEKKYKEDIVENKNCE